MKWETKNVTFLLFLLLSVLYVLPFLPIFAQTTDSVDTDIKISICGNFVVEKPAEDCEGLDLDGQSCESLGFQSGELSCDISCGFEAALCIPFPEPACGDGTLDAGEECEVGNPFGSSCEWSSCNETSCVCEEEPEEPEPEPEEPEPEPRETEEEEDEMVITPGEAPSFFSVLPDAVKCLDINGDGVIGEDEIERTVELWVNIWRNIVYDELCDCDVNGSGECDVYDFSIIMYYTGK
ncbi:MAG: hypothetical protein ABIC57_00220 [bacterium]